MSGEERPVISMMATYMLQYTGYRGIIRGIAKVGLVLVALVDRISGGIRRLPHNSEILRGVDGQKGVVQSQLAVSLGWERL